MSEATLTVVRYYRDGERLRVEAVLWRWVPGADGDSGRPGDGLDARVDAMEVARARPLPVDADPGLTPNRWVWIRADSPAVKFPRPSVVDRGESTNGHGETVETVEHQHDAGSVYWDYYHLPLRSGVELVTVDEWVKGVEVAKADEATRQAEKAAVAATVKGDRGALRASARVKLEKLGLSDAEVTAIIGS